ncbi:MAG: hypothetical protein Q8P51_14680 [Ignavibacteria bacterium]|nr:hypothetical protein [Ignavibacteria bacterium]
MKQETMGIILITIGVIGLGVAAGLRFIEGLLVPGDLPAVAMFFLLIGLVFYFPDLLKEASGAGSSMRVAVLMVVSLFVILTLKAGWTVTNLEELKIDQSWAWLIGVTLGAKMGQSFAEAWNRKK